MKKAAILKTFMFAALAAIAGAAGSAKAEPWGMEGHADCPGYRYVANDAEGRHPWMEKLNLTAEQKTKIDKIRSAQQEKVKPMAEQLRAEHEALRTLLQGDATDAQLRQQHQKAQTVRNAMADAWFESLLQIRAVLTPEQRKEMAVMSPHGRGPGMMGSHDGMGPQGPGSRRHGPMGGHPY